jgi:hypothetical protein
MADLRPLPSLGKSLLQLAFVAMVCPEMAGSSVFAISAVSSAISAEASGSAQYHC